MVSISETDGTSTLRLHDKVYLIGLQNVLIRMGAGMTSYRSGYCILCGEYSQSVSIEFPGLCQACSDKWNNPKTLKELMKRMQKRIDYLELSR